MRRSTRRRAEEWRGEVLAHLPDGSDAVYLGVEEHLRGGDAAHLVYKRTKEECSVCGSATGLRMELDREEWSEQ